MQKVKDLDEHFNYIFSEPDFWFDHNHKRIFDMDYNTNTTKDEKKKIEAFLKANDNITYAEYIKLTRELRYRSIDTFYQSISFSIFTSMLFTAKQPL